MIALLQRVSRAEVTVDGKTVGCHWPRDCWFWWVSADG